MVIALADLIQEAKPQKKLAAWEVFISSTSPIIPLPIGRGLEHYQKWFLRNGNPQVRNLIMEPEGKGNPSQGQTPAGLDLRRQEGSNGQTSMSDTGIRKIAGCNRRV